MKVAVFTTHIQWPSHYETELEIIQRHIDEGDTIVQLVCNASLPVCDINIKHNLEDCLNCIGKRKFGLKLIDQKITETSFLNLTIQNKQAISKIKKKFSSIKELQSYKIENFDIGYAVASSIISVLRDSNPDLTVSINAQLVYDYLVSAFTVYQSIQNFLKSTPVDRVYVFNGRLAHVKAAFRACQSLQVDCYIHERGNSINHYELFLNTLPHNIEYIHQKILNIWAIQTDLTKRNQVAESFYLDRVKGLEQGWYSFVKNQHKGLLPEEWNPNKKNLVIFNSSEDEYISIGDEWQYTIYDNQLEGIKQIIASMQQYAEEYHLYLRIHPNLKDIKNAYIDELCSLKGTNFTLIHADSPVSTYSLLQRANKVISFGSTVGIEANFWEIPSILLGKCFYMNLGGTYNPESHAEVILLLTTNLPPKTKLAALMYGYYSNTFGIEFKYYKAKSFASGKFKDSYLETNPTYAQIVNKLNKLSIWKKYRKTASSYHRKFIRKVKLGL